MIIGNQLPMFAADLPPNAVSDHYVPESRATLFHGDRLLLINEIERAGDKAELIVTSPPYNVGKEYEQRSPLEEYLELQRETIAACMRILSDTGSICWQVGHYIEGDGKDKEAFPLDLVLYPIFKEFGLRLKNRIIWTFGHGLHENFRLTGRHETILWFTRQANNYTFNLDPIRIPQKYPGKRAFRGEKKGQLSGNPLGKNPSDVWDMPNVKSNHIEKVDHPCQFPVGLIERLVLGLTNPDDLVLDPYAGVCTTVVAAVLHGRRAAGSDVVAKYLETGRVRVEMAFAGTLKTRDMNQPVYEPNPGNKLAQVPDEWK